MGVIEWVSKTFGKGGGSHGGSHGGGHGHHEDLIGVKNAIRVEEVRREAENKENLEKAKKASEAREKLKEYNERRAQQFAEEDAQQAFEESVKNKAQWVKGHIDDAVNYTYNPTRNDNEIMAQLSYIWDKYKNEPDKLNTLYSFIEKNSIALMAIGSLSMKESLDVHYSPADLLAIARNLRGQAKNMETQIPDVKDSIDPILKSIENQVIQLLSQQFKVNNPRDTSVALEQFMRKMTLHLTSDERRKFIESFDANSQGLVPARDQANPNQFKWENMVREIVNKDIDMDLPQDAKDTMQQAVEGIKFDEQGNKRDVTSVPGEMKMELDAELEKIAAPRINGDPNKLAELTIEDILKQRRRIEELRSKYVPKDKLPSSKAYRDAVQNLYDFAERYEKELSWQLAQKLKEEGPAISGMKKKEFLRFITEHKGRLGGILTRETLDTNPEIARLMLGTDEESVQFRDLVFLTIHTGVLNQRRESTQNTFGLYERADFTAFTDFLGTYMSDRVRKKDGKALGQAWIEHYTSLSNAIRLSRDMDWAAYQPGSDAENFQRAMGLYQNEYVYQLFSMPGVEQAYRCYEDVLYSIKDTFDNFIPPSLLEYVGTRGESFWDDRTSQELMKLLSTGVVKNIQRDEDGFPSIHDNGHSVKWSDKPLELYDPDDKSLQQLQLSMYMTLAKGFGIGSWRYLEIIASSKVPGSDMGGDNTLGDALHAGGIGGRLASIPYEGPARAMDVFNTVISKWKVGFQKYFYLVNQVLPHTMKIRHKNGVPDPGDAIKAYIAYKNGTFADIYGDEAKRQLDNLNGSNASSTFGPPQTGWRHHEATLGWTDKDKELLGGGTRIMLSGAYASKWLRDYLVIQPRKEEFRKKLKKQQELAMTDGRATRPAPLSGPEFDALWQEYLTRNKPLNWEIEEEWNRLRGITKDLKMKGHLNHDHANEQRQELGKAYQRAYQARVWVETALRNPFSIAHNLKVTIDDPLTGQERDLRLHTLLVHSILGISLEDTKYGTAMSEESSMSAMASSPTERQYQYMAEIQDLETDLASVREIAVREQRNLRESDFNIIKDPTSRRHAVQYWRKVNELMLGEAVDEADHENGLFKKLGLVMGDDGNYAVIGHHDSPQVSHIDDTLGKVIHYSANHRTLQVDGRSVEIKFRRRSRDHDTGQIIRFNNLLEQAVNTDFTTNFSSNDTAFSQMDIMNLGARQLLRRGGDVLCHWNGGNELLNLINNFLTREPNWEKIVEQMAKVKAAYQGDDVNITWNNCGPWFEMIMNLYKARWDPVNLHWGDSIAQTEIFQAKIGVEALRKDEEWHVLTLAEEADLFAASNHMYAFPFYDGEYSIHGMFDRRQLAWKEMVKYIALWGSLAAIGITLASALAKGMDDVADEDGGGGGHGGGHH